jgi:glycosyltransferase involved in cell wall biosynthesis
LHVPTAVGGHPGGLARAERELGLASVAVSLAPPAFGHAVDEVLERAGDSTLHRFARRGGLMLRALRAFDVVHFNYGRTLLPYPAEPHGLTGVAGRMLALRDLPVLRAAGKRVVVTFQGDDARLASVGGDLIEAVPEHYTPALDAARRRTIEAFSRYAHAIFFLNPDLGGVLPARATFLPYASVDPREWPLQAEVMSSPPLVVHAPSDPRVKGTAHVIAAVERLRAEGVALRFELVEGLPVAAAESVYRRAAIVVDQMLAGWYGGLAVEAMALGKPVVCAVREDALSYVPADLAASLPVVRATPATLADVLRRLLHSPEQRLAAALAGRAFVERWHDPCAVARTVVASYRD